MAATKQQPEFWIDGLFDFSQGINSGVDSLLLPRNQLSFAINSTVRGTFAQNRPGFNKITINYPDTATQTAVEKGLWQGGCFYTPDFGNPSLIAAISGHLYQFSINGSTATVKDISIPNNPNPSTPVQAWLWQSENYVIWNDGISLPVFFNGSTSVRSNGPQVVLGQIVSPFTAPLVGSIVTLTMAAPYNGPFNVPVIVNDPVKGTSLYQTLSSSSGTYADSVVLNFGLVGMDIPTGTSIISNPNIVGINTTAQSFPSGFTFGPGDVTVFIQLASPFRGNNGQSITLSGIVWTVSSFTGTQVTLVNSVPVNGYNINVGDQLFITGGSFPVSTAGITTSDFFLPNIGSSTNIEVDRLYNGTPHAIVYDNLGNEYSITSVPVSGPGSTALSVINLTDPAGTAHAVYPSIPLLSVPQLPAGRMGAYGLGRNWVSLTDGRQYVAGDIVGGSSGTPANNFRDAVLNITENTYLYGGGTFKIPGSIGDIRAMVFSSTLDTSLGQGPLNVYTPNVVFSNNAPVNRATWQALTNPIQTQTLISNGAQGQNSTIPANNDVFYRAIDGIRSLVLAQRQFQQRGNVPISYEVSRIMDLDDKSLLSYGSAIVFDNRMLMTATPTPSGQGVFHQTLIAFNFDPLSSQTNTLPAVYDGMWTGLNILQLITGLFSGQQRAFAFSYDTDLQKIELYEILTSPTNNFDNGSVPILWTLESPTIFKEVKGKGLFDLCRLVDGEIQVDEVQGQVNFQVFYKPDKWPCWVPWFSWGICSSGTQPGFQPRMGLGEPDATNCDTSTNRPFREAYTFQVKFAIQGRCRLLAARFKAVPVPDPLFAPPICSAPCGV